MKLFVTFLVQVAVLQCSAVDNGPCHNVKDDNECDISSDGLTVTCSGLQGPSSLLEVSDSTQHLNLCNSNLTVLGRQHIAHLNRLLTLNVVNSEVSFSPEPWPSSLSLQRIMLQHCWSVTSDKKQGSSSGSIFKSFFVPYLLIQPQVWSNLKTLQRLELRDNNITVPEELRIDGGFQALPPSCFIAIIDGRFECKASHMYLHDMITSGRASITNTTNCFILDGYDSNVSLTFSWKPFLTVLKFRKTLDQCPPACKCQLLGLISISRPILSVNCTNAGLTELPHTIPPFTSLLFLPGNKLTNIDDVFINHQYKYLSKCDFSNNQINSVNGTALVQYFSPHSHDISINLTNNNLRTFPVNELSVFYDTQLLLGKKHLPLFALSGNPWDCDNCSFSVPFKAFIYDHIYTIRDHNSITCYNTGQLLLTTDLGIVCNPPPWLLTPIDFVNIFMAILLAVILLDFFYNYYQYRRHGKLPWIYRNCKLC